MGSRTGEQSRSHRETAALLLALDTSTRTVGLALYDGISVIHESCWSSADYHTVEMAPAVANALSKAGRKIEAIRVIGVATGPGSFTGLRVGLALAKGLALAHRLPMIGIPTLDFLAAAQPLTEMPMAAVLRAGRGRLAVGWYENVQGLWKPAPNRAIVVLTPDELAGIIHTPTLVCGELSEEERIFFSRKDLPVTLASPAQSLRRPSFLAELAWKRWKSGKTDDPASLAPLYLHYEKGIADGQ